MNRIDLLLKLVAADRRISVGFQLMQCNAKYQFLLMWKS